MLFPDSLPRACYEIVFHLPCKGLQHKLDRSILQLVHAPTHTRMQTLHCAAEICKTVPSRKSGWGYVQLTHLNATTSIGRGFLKRMSPNCASGVKYIREAGAPSACTTTNNIRPAGGQLPLMCNVNPAWEGATEL